MKPLRSLKVLDLSLGNPFTASIFADYGATVIKAEPIGRGDPMRRRGSPDGCSDGPYYAFYGRGKKSLTVDYTKEEGKDIIKRLFSSVDFVIVNTKEKEMAALGLGYEDAKKTNPKIVYGVLTPFGESGPWKDMPDYDLIVMARCGLQENTGFPERPTKFGSPLSYFYGSLHLAGGMLAAYLGSLESGMGKKVSVSCWDAILSIDDACAQGFQGLNVLPRRIGNGFATTNPTDTFRCKDGWFALSIGSDAQWIAFAKRAGVSLWYEDERYAHDPARSMENYFGDLDCQLRDFFSKITVEEAGNICSDAMVPGSPCSTVKDLAENSPQVAARNMLIHVKDSAGNNTLQYGIPAKFLRDFEHDDEIAPAASLGADTEEILLKLGYDKERVAELKKIRVI